jgi:hypothetical protein
MNRLKKLAGIIKEDQDRGLMNKVNRISDPQVKKMFSDIAVNISDLKGFIMDMEETTNFLYKVAGLKKPSELPNFRREVAFADEAIDDIVRKLEDYITRVYG